MNYCKIDFSRTCPIEDDLYELKMRVRAAVCATLAVEGFPFAAQVSVTFCDPDYIHALNKQYRNVDRPTDVLSFPLYENGEFEAEDGFGTVSLGDIVLNLDRAREQAEEIGHPFLEEVQFLSIHSTLHLLGYDHERSPEDEEAQCEKQRVIMKTLLDAGEDKQ